MAEEVHTAEAPAVVAPIDVRLTHGDALLHVRLARPKANLIDEAMIRALAAAFGAQRHRAGLRGVLLAADGPNFSFGASVEEHLPQRCAAMLGSLHRLIIAMLQFPVPVLVAVRGQCLGGGLEIALAGSRMFVAPDAKLGQPEIKLGVFAPAASVLLPLRVRQPTAEDLLWTGRTVSGEEACALGLAQAVAVDAEAAAVAWFEAHLAPRSATSLACAVSAVRAPVVALVRRRLAELERVYLDQLMSTRDANEGLAAFMERRTPAWEHR